jgi:hypothetical protein
MLIASLMSSLRFSGFKVKFERAWKLEVGSWDYSIII